MHLKRFAALLIACFVGAVAYEWVLAIQNELYLKRIRKAGL